MRTRALEEYPATFTDCVTAASGIRPHFAS